MRQNINTHYITDEDICMGFIQLIELGLSTQVVLQWFRQIFVLFSILFLIALFGGKWRSNIATVKPSTYGGTGVGF